MRIPGRDRQRSMNLFTLICINVKMPVKYHWRAFAFKPANCSFREKKGILGKFWFLVQLIWFNDIAAGKLQRDTGQVFQNIHAINHLCLYTVSLPRHSPMAGPANGVPPTPKALVTPPTSPRSPPFLGGPATRGPCPGRRRATVPTEVRRAFVGGHNTLTDREDLT